MNGTSGHLSKALAISTTVMNAIEMTPHLDVRGDKKVLQTITVERKVGSKGRAIS